MLRCHKGLVIRSDDSSSGVCDLQQNRQLETLAYNSTSPNLPISVFTLGKINKILKPLKKKKLTDLDLKLFMNANNGIDFDSDDRNQVLADENETEYQKYQK